MNKKIEKMYFGGKIKTLERESENERRKRKNLIL